MQKQKAQCRGRTEYTSWLILNQIDRATSSYVAGLSLTVAYLYVFLGERIARRWPETGLVHRYALPFYLVVSPEWSGPGRGREPTLVAGGDLCGRGLTL